MSLEKYQTNNSISIRDRLPSKDEFLSDEYINNIIKTEKWVEHGSHLEYFLMDMKEEEDFPLELSKLSDKEIIAHEAFKPYLTEWLNHRYNYVVEWLEIDIERTGFPLLVNRSVFLTSESQQDIVDGKNKDLGRHWGLSNTDTWGVDPDENNHLLETNIVASIAQSDIDWIETLKSRMDYLNGDQESEIYLHEKAQPVVQSVFCSQRDIQLPIKDKVIETAVQAHLCDWLTDGSLEEINQGYCADFADGFFRSAHGKKLEKVGIKPDVAGCYDLEDIVFQGLNKANPSWSNWKQIELLAKKNVFNHSFIQCDNKYYDAECVTGVDCAFDLPIFERAANEYKALVLAEREKQDSELSC